jgi:exodeoxyribonuclease VII large subunit
MRLKTFSVSELNGYIKRLMSVDPILNAVKVSGEIGNFKAHGSGHAYFTLKDEDSRINCVMFSSHFQRLNFIPKDGERFELFGRVSVYEKNGNYQLYVNEMIPDGLGELHMQFVKLKNKLEKEGLFDEQLKKKLKSSPQKIAVITSPTGAAIQDVISVLKRRNPLLHILVIPANVQGDKTVGDVVTAFRSIEKMTDLDAVILTRGGGSYEELFVFNSELIARKIFECKFPVISAIGHEIDFTIADFVADLRAPTPSAAAELVTDDIWVQMKEAKALIDKMKYHIMTKIERIERYVGRFEPKHMGFTLEKRLVDSFHSHDILKTQMIHSMGSRIEKIRHSFEISSEKLSARNPIEIINRGFSRISNADGRPIRSVEEVEIGKAIINELKGGRIISTVTDKEGSHE